MEHHPGKRSLLRTRGAQARAKVTNIELFFDLVFAFALTQLSHALLNEMDLQGALHTGLLFLAIWWIWIYTCWSTNWLDPEAIPVRVLLFVLMLAGLVIAAVLPQAFGNQGEVFAAAYVGLQVGRTLFVLWAMRHTETFQRRNMQRVFAWMLLSAPLWLAGGWQQDELRLLYWLGAMAVEFLAPALGFWVPVLGRSQTVHWNVEGGHMAERCSQFVLIALGESITVTGARYAGLHWDAATLAAFTADFVGSAAMWWIYFNIGVERGSRHIVHSDDPGRVARIAYTYLHLLIVAGVIVGAVGDDLVLAHPLDGLHAGVAAAVIGGAALFLLGNLFFKWMTSPQRWIPLSHLVGLGCLAVLAGAAYAVAGLTPLQLGAAVAAVLCLVAAWETISLRGWERAPAR